MGCVGSKSEESPAVKLCRERCEFLNAAVKERYAFAQAHLLYMQSLKRIGVSLRDYIEQDLDDDEPYAAVPPAQPSLPKATKKGVESKTSSPEDLPQHLHSNSGSHLNFDTDSDEDGDVSSGSLHHHHRHHSGSSPLQPQRGYTMMNEDETLGYGGGGYMHMNYMRKQPTAAVSYQQKPMSPEAVNMNYYYSSHGNANSSSSYQQFNGYGVGGQNGGYYGSPGGFRAGGGIGEGSGSSSSKPPPPPPSPPRGLTWDFLNFFESNYCWKSCILE